MKLDKIYKYLGIDPDVKGCTCRDEEGVCQAKWQYGGQHCFPHEYETCKQAVTWTDYPDINVNDIPDSYIFLLQDLLCSNRIIGIRYDEDFEKPYSYNTDNLECIGKTRNEAIFVMLDVFCKNDMFTKEQKDKLFYLMSYIGEYAE